MTPGEMDGYIMSNCTKVCGTCLHWEEHPEDFDCGYCSIVLPHWAEEVLSYPDDRPELVRHCKACELYEDRK